MAQNDVLSLLFGKKKRRKTRKKSTKGRKKVGKTKRIKVGYCIKSKKSGVVKVYKTKQGKKVIRTKHYYNKRKCNKRVYKKKTDAVKAYKRKYAKKKSSFGRRTRRRRAPVRRRRLNNFGVGGSYMPTSAFASPYPSSVDAAAPWL